MRVRGERECELSGTNDELKDIVLRDIREQLPPLSCSRGSRGRPGDGSVFVWRWGR